MSRLHIEDIKISYQGHDLSQYGLFPLLAWYLMDVIKLPDYFEQVTVNKSRNPKNNKNNRRPKAREFTDAQMCMGLIALPILGIGRIGKINDRLSRAYSEILKPLGIRDNFSQNPSIMPLF